MTSPAAGPPLRMKAWSFIVAFGWISLLGDFVYEGARSITGPLLASLGASAALVGLITGAGEATALLLRLLSGPLADRTRRFWTLAITGYVLTIVSVPLLGFAAALWVAAALVITERVGKAVRSPAKDTMLSHATASVGRGKGFAIQEAMDQAGAVLGPLAVAAMLAATGNDYGPSLLVLALPGVAMLIILFWLRFRVPATEGYEIRPPAGRQPTVHAPAILAEPPRTPAAPAQATRLPGAFWLYAAFTALTATGFSTFGVLSFHMVEREIIAPPVVPIVYAAVMGIDAVAALGTGWLYDRHGAASLALLPIVAGFVPVFAFAGTATPVVVGALLWGCVVGIQESTLRAVVADLVAPGRRATAYGLFAAVIGCGALAGGVLAGLLYQTSIPALVLATAAIQLAALLLLLVILKTMRAAATAGE